MISDGATTPKRRRGPGKPFQKGASGNPRGRKPVPPEVKEIFLANDEKAARRIVEFIDDPDPNVALKAATYLYERNHGKTPQPVEHSGPEGGPLTVEIRKFLEDAAPENT